jgi:hypothetical protein
MAWHGAILNLGRSFTDEDHVAQSPGSRSLGPHVWPALGSTRSQALRQFLAKSASRLHE